jgi:hypothetical protein
VSGRKEVPDLLPPGTPVASLRNIGPASARWLAAIGVHTLADLEQLGAAAACRILKGHGYRVSLNLAYAIEGALRDMDWRRLPARTRDQLAAGIRGEDDSK